MMIEPITEEHKVRFRGVAGATDHRKCIYFDCEETPVWALLQFPGNAGTWFLCSQHALVLLTGALNGAEADLADAEDTANRARNRLASIKDAILTVEVACG